MDLRPEAAPLTIPARPDETGGRRVGVLLTHGFSGSPASMRPWAEHLAARGYGVSVPRLPGHGTRWQDLNATGWDDWYGEVRRAFTELEADSDVVVGCGLSMGGSLTLRLAADAGDRLAGVVLVNPAVNLARKDVLALPVLKWFIGAFPGVSNDIAKEGVDECAYDRTPLKAAHSMLRSWKVLREDLGRVDQPLLLFKSVTDHLVDPSSREIILSAVSSTDVTERPLLRSYHVATVDHDAEMIFTESADFVARVTQHQGAPS